MISWELPEQIEHEEALLEAVLKPKSFGICASLGLQWPANLWRLRSRSTRCRTQTLVGQGYWGKSWVHKVPTARNLSEVIFCLVSTKWWQLSALFWLMVSWPRICIVNLVNLCMQHDLATQYVAVFLLRLWYKIPRISFVKSKGW